VARDAEVGEVGRLRPVHHPSGTGPVHLDAEEIPVGLGLRTRQQVLAVAEADLQHHRRLAPKDFP
jgi:hypothetical protein